MNTFVPYADKSAAKRGFGRSFKDLASSVNDYLEQVEGKWGFYKTEAGAAVIHPRAVDVDLGVLNDMTKPVVATAAAAAPSLASALAEGDDDEDEGGFAPLDGPSPSVFGRFAAAQLTASPIGPTPAAAPARPAFAASKIEKDRPEQNGVKRPSAGTICARVWDIASTMSDGGIAHSDGFSTRPVATLSEVVKAAEAFGINKFTARTQYARWRVFHGITGRAA